MRLLSAIRRQRSGLLISTKGSQSKVALSSHSAATRAPEPNAKPEAGKLFPLPLKYLGFPKSKAKPGVGDLCPGFLHLVVDY